MDEVVLEGKTYVASRKAAQDFSYTQDYVGQLIRKGLIDAKKVSGHWYVNLDSLSQYKTNADTFKPEPPKYEPDPNAEAKLDVDGKEYVSAATAAKITEYNQDYVGQLARAGKIPSRQVGNRWYVERTALLAHKQEKDAMLRAVQAESVGLKKPEPLVFSNSPLARAEKVMPALMTYSKEENPLFPEISEEGVLHAVPATPEVMPLTVATPTKIGIRIVPTVPAIHVAQPALTYMPSKAAPESKRTQVSVPEMSIFYKLFPALAFCLILVAFAGGAYLKRDAIYTALNPQTSQTTQSASVAASGFTERLVMVLEAVLSKELVYIRQN